MGIARIKYLSQLRPKSSLDTSLKNPSTSQQLPGHPISFMERTMISLGLRKVSDEEYLKRMKQTRDGYLEQIRILEERGKEHDDNNSGRQQI
jgi:hypothetical protein